MINLLIFIQDENKKSTTTNIECSSFYMVT